MTPLNIRRLWQDGLGKVSLVWQLPAWWRKSHQQKLFRCHGHCVSYIVNCILCNIQCAHTLHANTSLDCECSWWCRRLELIKSLKHLVRKAKKCVHEGYQKYSDSIEVQLASKEKECNWQNVTWQEVSVQWPWKEFIWCNILFHLVLFYIISWQKISGQWLCWPSKESNWCSILFFRDEMSVELQAQTWKWKYWVWIGRLVPSLPCAIVVLPPH